MSKFKPEDRVRIVGSDGTEVLGIIIAINPEGNRVVIRDDDNVLHRENVEDIEMCEKAPVGFTFKVGDRVRSIDGQFPGKVGMVIQESTGVGTRVKFDNGAEIDKNTNYLELIEDEPTTLKDSGDRREFETGAVRDMAKGKGRCDLLPLGTVGFLVGKFGLFQRLEDFRITGERAQLRSALQYLGMHHYLGTDGRVESDAYLSDLLLDVSLQFEAGAEKYGEGNWQKGIPTNVYIDSSVRHYLKHLRGDTDEPHLRATVWNLLCCLWTVENMPDCLNTYAKGD